MRPTRLSDAGLYQSGPRMSDAAQRPGARLSAAAPPGARSASVPRHSIGSTDAALVPQARPSISSAVRRMPSSTAANHAKAEPVSDEWGGVVNAMFICLRPAGLHGKPPCWAPWAAHESAYTSHASAAPESAHSSISMPPMLQSSPASNDSALKSMATSCTAGQAGCHAPVATSQKAPASSLEPAHFQGQGGGGPAIANQGLVEHLSSSSAQSSSSASQAAKLIQEGHRANKQGDYKRARTLFDCANTLAPSPAARFSAANMALKLGDASEAMETYLDLLKEGGTNGLPRSRHELLERKLREAASMLGAQRDHGTIAPGAGGTARRLVEDSPTEREITGPSFAAH